MTASTVDISETSRDLLRDPWILLAGLCWLAIFLSRGL